MSTRWGRGRANKDIRRLSILGESSVSLDRIALQCGLPSSGDAKEAGVPLTPGQQIVHWHDGRQLERERTRLGACLISQLPTC